ncbi:Phospholipid/glycerol acyltransferase [uncultured Paludibacter sp.]|uniref:Phospholipid/glycerol acyltransferase n=1 Tax=uncultured Paludibacter sp. TaxID=497635 RepID=A0A653AC13_9BACT|nr:Phospholipid/glycerol acyltransferase [uncultured Paludibacter sp.]
MIENTHYIDFEEVIRERLPNKKLPRPVYLLLKKIAHVDDFNNMFSALSGKMNLEFMHGVIDYLNLSVTVFGKENLKKNDKPMIFSSNHPLGALDAVTMGHVLGNIYGEKIKFYANEFLNELKPVREMFLPIYKYSSQSRSNAETVQEFFESDNHLITFPAGATSRMRKNGLQDLVWHKNFIQKSIQYQRDVVPLYFNAQNSRFFYTLQKIRELIHSKQNFEMLLLASEIFKQKGNQYTFYIGEPVLWETFDKSKTPIEWAAWMREKTYQLPGKYEIG